MLRAFAGVARAPFLLLPITLIAVGAAAGAYEGAFSWVRSLLALGGLLGLHVAVNSFNEASDFRSGIDLETRRTPFSGGSGTLPAGHLSPRAAVLLGVLGTAVGLAVGLWFLRVVGLRMLPLMVVGAIAVLAYSELLARAYLGEFFAGLGLGAMPVLGAALVQDGELGSAAVAASIPAFLMTFNLLLLNEFPDEEADLRGGRRNLLKLLGRSRAAHLYGIFALAVPVVIAVSCVRGDLPPPALAGVAPSALLVRPLRWAFGGPAAAVPIPALGANVAWNLLTNSLLAAGLALTAWGLW